MRRLRPIAAGLVLVLAVIVLRLNGRPVPMKRSQAFVIERASRQSRTNAQ